MVWLGNNLGIYSVASSYLWLSMQDYVHDDLGEWSCLLPTINFGFNFARKDWMLACSSRQFGGFGEEEIIMSLMVLISMIDGFL